MGRRSKNAGSSGKESLTNNEREVFGLRGSERQRLGKASEPPSGTRGGRGAPPPVSCVGEH